MKNNNIRMIAGKLSAKLAIVVALTVVFVACDKYEAVDAEMAVKTENSISSTNDNADTKRGKPAQAPGSESIAAIAIGAGFSELVSALVFVDEELDAGLVNLFLNGKDQFTVFAPTNAAFETLYDNLGIDGITDLPASLVLDVLFYHVAEGRRGANSVVPPVRPRSITTLLGERFSVDKNGKITAIGNTANIVAADISASNGFIHVIDAVILPF